LYAQNNQLTSLPESIRNLKHIEKIHLDFYFKDFIADPAMLKFVSFYEEQGDTKPAMKVVFESGLISTVAATPTTTYARYVDRVSRRLKEERAEELQWPSPRIGYEPSKSAVLILDARL